MAKCFTPFAGTRHILSLFLGCLLSVLAGCQDDSRGSGHGQAQDPRVRMAIAALDRPDMSDQASLLLAMLQLAYGIDVENDPVAIFEGWIVYYSETEAPDVVAVMSMYRRIYDGTVLPDGSAIDAAGSLDRETLLAIFCDRLELPADFRDTLMVNSAQGGYAATHVLLAHLFLRTSGCNLVLSDADVLEIQAQTAAAIDLDDGGLSDLDVEAMALLAASGRMDLVPGQAVDALYAAQLASGGWPLNAPIAIPDPGLPTEDHATALALWFLLAQEVEGGFAPLLR